MTATQLASQIIERRGGQEAWCSCRQAQWLRDLLLGFVTPENPGSSRETYYLDITDGDDANAKTYEEREGHQILTVEFRFPFATAKITAA